MGEVNHVTQVSSIVDLCSDPYGTGCRRMATGSVRGWEYNMETEATEEIIIYFCNDCSNWEVDWDWDKQPEGPALPLKRKVRA